ncbi:MAG: ATPase, T2SS/T4P/T4SS family [Lachnospiraceae bacterium]
MPIFNQSKKNFYVTEDGVSRYGNEPLDLNQPQDMRKIVLYLAKNIADGIGKIGLEDEKDLPERKRYARKNAISVLRSMGYNEEHPMRQSILEHLDKYLWGYYILDDLINDPEVTDIRVLGWNYIRYKKLGKRYKSPSSFVDEEDYSQFVHLLAVRNKKNLSDINAVTFFTDSSNEHFILRFNICTSFISSNKVPVLTIRKIPKDKYTIYGLIEKGMLDEQVADYLMDKALNASGMLFTGKGASGKTTLMNTLLEYIAEDASAVVIQESDELFISHKFDTEGNLIPSRDIAFLHTVMSCGEGRVEYTMPELTRNGLRMDLDYYILGEIKGDEAEGFSMASYTGHKCWATVHGMNSYEGINKLADYIKQATGYEFEDCLKKLIGMEVVIFMKEFRVSEITEIHGYNEREKDLNKRVVYRDGRWLC